MTTEIVHYLLDETTGSLSADSSAEDNSLVIRGSVVLSMVGWVDYSHYEKVFTDQTTYYTTPNTWDLGLAALPFTVEGTVSTAVAGDILFSTLDGGTGWQVYLTSGKYIVLDYYISGVGHLAWTSTAQLADGDHFAVVRNLAVTPGAPNLYVYINGVRIYQVYAFRYSGDPFLPSTATTMRLSNQLVSARITKGVALYTGATHSTPSSFLTAGYPKRVPGYSGYALEFSDEGTEIWDTHGTQRAYSVDPTGCSLVLSGISFFVRFKTSAAVGNARVLFARAGYDPAVVSSSCYFSDGIYIGENRKVYLGVSFAVAGNRFCRAISSDTVLNDGQWHEIFGTISKHCPAGWTGCVDPGIAELNLYVDGIKQASSGFTMPDNSLVSSSSNARWLVGSGELHTPGLLCNYFGDTCLTSVQSSYDRGAGAFTGLIDECRAWCGILPISAATLDAPEDPDLWASTGTVLTRRIVGPCIYPYSTSRACSPTSESPRCAVTSRTRLIPSNR
jgi:hypothetical protein